MVGATVLIVDDHRLFAEVIRSTLEGLGMRIVGVAGSARQALAITRRQHPAIVLLDLGLPDGNGLEVGRVILQERPETRVLALTASNDPRAISEAMQSGFHGYVIKDTPLDEFVGAIGSAIEGQVVVVRNPQGPVNRRAGTEEGAASLIHPLTPRESEVLSLIVEGLRSKEMAKRMGVSLNTVRTHVQSVLSKLEVHSRLEAATFAVRNNLVAKPEEGVDEALLPPA